MPGENEQQGLSPEELEAQEPEQLPDREAMSLIAVDPSLPPPPLDDMPVHDLEHGDETSDGDAGKTIQRY